MAGAITSTLLTNGGSTSASSFPTASVTPTANAIVTVLVTNTTSSTTPTGIVGCGITFTKVTSASWTSGKIVRTASLWYGTTASPTAGAITITFSTSNTACNWQVFQHTGGLFSGTNGADGIGQSGTASGSGTATFTFGSAIGANDIVLALVANSSGAATAGAGMTVSTSSAAVPFLTSELSTIAGSPLAVSATFTGNGVIIALQVKSSNNAGGPGQLFPSPDSLDMTNPFNRNNPRNVGLVGWWPTLLTRGSPTLLDVARGANGTLAGPTQTWLYDENAGFLGSYNGSSNAVSLGTPSQLNLSGAMTISAWINVTGITSNSCIVSNLYYNGSQNVGQYAIIVVAQTVGFGFAFEWYTANASQAATFYTGSPGTGTLQLNTTYHILVTRDASRNVLMWFNGSPATASGVVGSQSVPTTGFSNTYLGREGDGETGYYQGFIGTVKIWNRQLSAAEAYAEWHPATRYDDYNRIPPYTVVGNSTTIVPLGASVSATVGGSATVRRLSRLPFASTLTSSESAALVELFQLAATPAATIAATTIMRRMRRLPFTSTLTSQTTTGFDADLLFAASLQATVSSLATLRRESRLPFSSTLTSSATADIDDYIALAAAIQGTVAATVVLRRLSRLPFTSTLAASVAADMESYVQLEAAPQGTVTSFPYLRRLRRPADVAGTLAADYSALLAIVSFISFASSVQPAVASVATLRRLRRFGTITSNLVSSSGGVLVGIEGEGDSLYLETRLLKYMFDLTAFSVPSTLYVAISTTLPTDDVTGSTLAEPTDPSYSRVAVTQGMWQINSLGAAINNVPIVFPVATEAWTGNYLVLVDSPVGGNIYKYAYQPTPLTVGPGGTITLPALTASRFAYPTDAELSAAWRRIWQQFIFQGSAIGVTGSVSITLLQSLPGQTQTGLDLAETWGQTYYRAEVGVGSAIWQYDDTLFCIKNLGSITYPIAQEDWGTFPYYAVTTVMYGGFVAMVGTFPSPVTVNTGDTLVLAPGDVQVRIRAD